MQDADDDPEAPLFALGAIVRVVPGEGRSPRTGAIIERIWHHKSLRWHYWIRAGNRKISRRYSAVELVLARHDAPT